MGRASNTCTAKTAAVPRAKKRRHQGLVGSLLAFIDADDLMTPDRIATQVRFLLQHREVGIVFSDYDEFGIDKTQTAATSRLRCCGSC